MPSLALPSPAISPASAGVSHPTLQGSHQDSAGDLAKKPLYAHGIFPILPEEFKRYERGRSVAPSDKPLVIPACTQSFPTTPPPPDSGWISAVHPDGARYFMHNGKRVLTDAYICDDEIRKTVQDLIDCLERFAAANGASILHDTRTGIVLDILSTVPSTCGYYLVNHEKRSIFWLEDFELPSLSGNLIKGLRRLSDIQHHVRSQYWHHCDLFPDPAHISLDVLQEIRDRLIHSISDSVMSSTSTIPHNTEKLESMLGLVDHVMAYDHMSLKMGRGSAATIARLMHEFVRHEFLNYYGQQWARLDRFQSVHGHIPRQTFLVRYLSPVCFFMPERHRETLEDLFVDELVSYKHYAGFVQRMTAEWQEIVLYATVVLNANMAFLAITSVDETASDVDGRSVRSVVQICSYVSVIASTGSLMLGLALVRRMRMTGKEKTTDVGEFLLAHKHEYFGFEVLAVIYSLPSALFTWGMVAFSAAFSCLCFQATALTTLIPTVLLEVLVVVLLAWTIVTLNSYGAASLTRRITAVIRRAWNGQTGI